MKVLILVEGQTEETFVRDALGPYLEEKDIFAIPTILVTKHVKTGASFKGGIVAYSRVKGDLKKLLNDGSANLVTTMLDFYGLPEDFPGMQDLPDSSPFERVKHLESSVEQDISTPKFLAYFSLHEFEALLFTDPAEIQRAFPRVQVQSSLERIKAEFNSPEEIDDHPQTAPSKRITRVCGEYRKPLHGPQIAKEIGIERLRQECKHFDQWIVKIVGLSTSNDVK